MKSVKEEFYAKSKKVELILVTQIDILHHYQVVVSDATSSLCIDFNDKQNAYKAFDLVKEAMK